MRQIKRFRAKFLKKKFICGLYSILDYLQLKWEGKEKLQQFNLKQPDRHLVIEVEGQQLLMDSGSPASVGSLSAWTSIGQTYPLIREYLGITTKFLSWQIGSNIDILLGSDILQTIPFIINTKEGMVIFDPVEPFEDGVKVSLSFCMGIPMIPVILGVAIYTCSWIRAQKYLT